MNDQTRNITGGCYCGRVRYRAQNVSTEVTECHCSQCRKQSGHRYAVVGTRSGDIEITGGGSVTWFNSSPQAERGFCSACGSHLFWWSSTDDEVAILAASVENPQDLHLTKHIFVDSKGPYYDIDDGLPQFTGYDTPHS